ncbi:MAG: hypothetical protein WEE89_14835 [Gemmatimonadota bacterium]
MDRHDACWAALLLIGGLTIVHTESAAQRTDTIVRLAHAPRYSGVATLVPELKIGMVDGPPEYLFGGPSNILLQRDGSIVVVDYAGMGSPMIRRYDKSGKFLRNVGGRGEGPGEYRGPTGLAELADGRILLSDPRNRRVTIYSAAGVVETTWNLSEYSYAIRGVEQLKVAPNGMVHMRFSEPTRELGNSEISILRLRADGTIVDTIKPPALPDFELPRLTATSASGRGRVSMTVPYWPRAFWTFSSRGYFITALPNRYSIDIKQGNQVVSIRRNVEPIAISAEERQEQRDFTRDRLRAFGTFNGSVPDVPRTKPYFKWITTFDDGRIWASLSTRSERYDPPTRTVEGRTQPSLRWREPTMFDVFEPDGTYVGQVAVPDGIYLESVRGDVAWGYTRGEEDVPYVVRYRIAWKR